MSIKITGTGSYIPAKIEKNEDKMIEEEKDCRSVIHQMNAAKTAIDRAIGYTVANHLENSI